MSRIPLVYVKVGRTSQIDAGVAGIEALVDTRFTPVRGEFSVAVHNSLS